MLEGGTLTLTLSLRERGLSECVLRFILSLRERGLPECVLRFILSLRERGLPECVLRPAFHPLPEGEGRGEGKTTPYCSRLDTIPDILFDCFSMLILVCISTCSFDMLDASAA